MKREAKKSVRIALIQESFKGGLNGQFNRTLRRIEHAAARGARIICLQELFKTPYFCQTEDVKKFDLAEPVPGPTTDVLSRVAAKNKIVLIAPLFEKRGKGVYHNTAAVIDADGQYLGKYRKMHIPDDPGYYEKFYFAPGDLGFRTFQTRYAKISILICWDQWFCEAARLAALSGADILFYPTAIGYKPRDIRDAAACHSAWETVQRGHAVANGIFVAAVNRVGRENKLQFWGQSFVADPFGRLLCRASSSKDQVLIADCDLSLVEKTRREWPFLRDRRIDAYKPITQRLIDLIE